jgi:RNA-directed DNA polymerase
MSLKHARHQKPGQSGRTSGGKGEPQLAVASDEESSAGHIQEGSGQVDLLQQVLLRGNLVKAWKHVKANKGSAGIDGLTIEQTTEYLKTHWSTIREELLGGQRFTLPRCSACCLTGKYR